MNMKKMTIAALSAALLITSAASAVRAEQPDDEIVTLAPALRTGTYATHPWEEPVVIQYGAPAAQRNAQPQEFVVVRGTYAAHPWEEPLVIQYRVAVQAEPTNSLRGTYATHPWEEPVVFEFAAVDADSPNEAVAQHSE